jgi:hypothetical protein
MPRYHLDLAALPLTWLQERIARHEILPARRILQEKMPERFASLRKAGIETVADVVSALKDRGRIGALAERTGLPEEYLLWLAREARSYRPNPFALRDISGLDPIHIEALERLGIKTTKALFDRAVGRADRARLAEETGIPEPDLLATVKLADLARIRGMGKTFVRLFASAGADCVDVLAREESTALHERLYAVNAERGLSSVVPSLKDVAEYIEMANELPKDLEL